MLYSLRKISSLLVLLIGLSLSSNAISCASDVNEEALSNSTNIPATVFSLTVASNKKGHSHRPYQSKSEQSNTHSESSLNEDCECCDSCSCISCTGCSASCGFAAVEKSPANQSADLSRNCLSQLQTIYASLIPSPLEHPPK